MITLTSAFREVDMLSQQVTNADRNQNEAKPFFDFNKDEGKFLDNLIDKYDKDTIIHFQRGNYTKPFISYHSFSADSTEGKRKEDYNIFDNKSGQYETDGNAPKNYMWYSYGMHSEPADDGNPESSTYDVYYNQASGLNILIDRTDEPDSQYNVMFWGGKITSMTKKEEAEDKTTYSVYNTDGTIQKEYVDYKANDNMSGFQLFFSNLFGGTPKDEIRTYSENSNKPQVEATQFKEEEMKNMFGYFDYFFDK